jgi:hypothetical protein
MGMMSCQAPYHRLSCLANMLVWLHRSALVATLHDRFWEAAMRNHLVGSLFGSMWIVLAVALVAAYATGIVGAVTSIVSGICLLALGAIGYKVGSDMSHPDETIEQILYETEHPSEFEEKRAA